MTARPPSLVHGEFSRLVDDRHRITLPHDWLALLQLDGNSPQLTLVKESPGALSLWPAVDWREKHERLLRVLEARWQASGQDEAELQRASRLISARFQSILNLLLPH